MRGRSVRVVLPCLFVVISHRLVAVRSDDTPTTATSVDSPRKMTEAVFQNRDQDGDGFLSRDEYVLPHAEQD